MQPHGKSSTVRPSRTNRKVFPPKLLDSGAAEVTTLTCSGCGKPGVSICAKCAVPNKKKYRTPTAQAHPLQERDPELYKRLDKMSRLPLNGNQKLWDEFCIEIGAERYYEYMPILVEIMQEGKWRTETLYPRKWLRANLARRVKRVSAAEDYDPTGKRRACGPRFDERSGALTAYATQPFTEFEALNQDGDTISGEEVILRKSLQASVQDDDGYDRVVMPADRESQMLLGRMTLAERYAASLCEFRAEQLEQDRPAFDQVLADAMSRQRELVERIGLDPDEAEVLAVIELLWHVGPRMYLNFLDKTNNRRIRNAWDRFDRKRKKPEWATLFRQTLREFTNKTRATWSHEWWE